MQVINLANYTLHKEAADMLDQAERAGWDIACIVKVTGALYPIISLSLNSSLDMSVGVDAVPGLVSQSLRYRLAEDGPTNYIEIRYNRPVISPEQAVALIHILEKRNEVNR